MKKIITFSMLFLLSGMALIAQSKNIRLFYIERNKNTNIVCYDLVTKNKSINTENPIHAYWKNLATDGSIDELSMLEKKMAYGFSVKSVDGTRVTFTMTAYDKRLVKVVFDAASQKADAYITIKNTEAKLEKLYIFATPSSYRSVEYIILTGTNSKTGEKVSERINNN